MLHLILHTAAVAALTMPMLAVAAAPSLEAGVHASIRDAFCPKPAAASSAAATPAPAACAEVFLPRQ